MLDWRTIKFGKKVELNFFEKNYLFYLIKESKTLRCGDVFFCDIIKWLI